MSKILIRLYYQTATLYNMIIKIKNKIYVHESHFPFVVKM